MNRQGNYTQATFKKWLQAHNIKEYGRGEWWQKKGEYITIPVTDFDRDSEQGKKIYLDSIGRPIFE